MKKVPVPSLKPGDLIACDENKSIRKRIGWITERTDRQEDSDRVIYIQFTDHSIVPWNERTDEPKAWLVQEVW